MPTQGPLERCVGDPEAFLAASWGRRPVLGDQEYPGSFDDLLSLRDVDRILTSTSPRLPAFRLVKDGTPVPPSEYTRTARTGSQPVTGMADPARIFEQFEGGATIVLQGLQRSWLPLREFCRALEDELGHPVQVNAYITPPSSQGLAVHRDSHDVFVLQVHGAKHWLVYERGDEKGAGTPLIDNRIRAGRSLYIPRGFPHAARAGASASTHLTIGILSPTWWSVAQRALRRIEESDRWQETLPVRYNQEPDAFHELVADRLHSLAEEIERLEPDDVADEVAHAFHTTRLPMLMGHLEQLLLLPEVSDESVVVRRRSATCKVVPGDRLVLLLGDRALRLPAHVEPAVRAMIDGDPVRVSDLSPYLDAEGRLVLVRRLIREGLLEVAE